MAGLRTMTLSFNTHRRSLMAVCLLIPMCSEAQTCNGNFPSATPTERFLLVDDATATDRQTGLQWWRCAEGQRWQDGRCTGSPQGFTWDEAMKQYGQPDAAGWRLPGLKELTSIVELACWSPTINTTVFPNAPPQGFWSALAVPADSPEAWAVSFQNGFAYRYQRMLPQYVRLVRTPR